MQHDAGRSAAFSHFTVLMVAMRDYFGACFVLEVKRPEGRAPIGQSRKGATSLRYKERHWLP
jgi:hypothetical protein